MKMRGYLGPDFSQYRERFLSSFEERDGHMIWTGKYDGNSPIMRLDRKLYYTSGEYRAFNLAWLFLREGWLPEGDALIRMCDEPRCVNPWHYGLTSPEGRFWDSVEVGDEILPGLDSPCSNWTRYVDPDGYGRFDGQPAHRWIEEQRNGPIPEGIDLHHLCYNKRCVNTDHLMRVTREEHVRLHRIDKLRGSKTPPNDEPKISDAAD